MSGSTLGPATRASVSLPAVCITIGVPSLCWGTSAKGKMTVDGQTAVMQPWRSPWQMMAAGLVVAPVVIALGGMTLQAVLSGTAPDGWASALIGLPLYGAVPVLAAWLAPRADAPRAPLGLVMVATWAAVVHLPNMATWVVPTSADLLGLTEHNPSLLGGLATTAVVLMLVATRQALTARGDSSRLQIPVPRTAAAASIVLWAVASAGWRLAHLPAWSGEAPQFPAALWSDRLVALLALMVVLMVIAAAVRRCDSLMVVPATLVVTVIAVWTSLVNTSVLLTDNRPLMGPAGAAQIPDSNVGLVLQLAAAAVLTVATVRLSTTARVAWRHHQPPQLP